MTNFTVEFNKYNLNENIKKKLDKVNKLSDKELKLLAIMLGRKTRDEEAIIDILDLQHNPKDIDYNDVYHFLLQISPLLPELYEIWKKRINFVTSYQNLQEIVDATRKHLNDYYSQYSAS